eukprot:3217891-Prymnesium_polylepis.1
MRVRVRVRVSPHLHGRGDVARVSPHLHGRGDVARARRRHTAAALQRAPREQARVEDGHDTERDVAVGVRAAEQQHARAHRHRRVVTARRRRSA